MEKSNRIFMMKEDKTTIPTFTKFVPIRMVAKSFLGWVIKKTVALAKRLSSSLSSSTVAGLMEKNAFSEAENTATQARKNNIMRILISTLNQSDAGIFCFKTDNGT